MKKLLGILLLMVCILTSQAQTKFNPDQSSSKEVQSGTTALQKPNFREFSGFSYEVLAGVTIPSYSGLTFYSFGFFPRYNILAPKDWISLSAGSPTTAGVDFAAGSFGTLFRYMVDIPLTLDVNIGARATAANRSLFGAFLGAGLDYDFMHISYNDEKIDVNTFGPVIHGGMRWTINGRPSGVRISYLNGISFDGNPANKVFSFNFVYGL